MALAIVNQAVTLDDVKVQVSSREMLFFVCDAYILIIRPIPLLTFISLATHLEASMFKLPSFITSFSRRLRRLLFQKEKDEDVAAAGASTGSDGETTTEGAAHDDEIPDGGLVACVQVFVGYLVFMNTWGYIASYVIKTLISLIIRSIMIIKGLYIIDNL